MEPAAPIVHDLTSSDDAVVALVTSLTDPERERTGTGAHVVVHVADGRNVAYARIHDAQSIGDGSQRWLEQARRGASPGGWSEAHHPRSEQALGAWRDANAPALDRLLIQHSKLAWRLDADAPYVVEFGVVSFAEARTTT